MGDLWSGPHPSATGGDLCVCAHVVVEGKGTQALDNGSGIWLSVKAQHSVPHQ